MASYPFLSPEWVEAVRAIRSEHPRLHDELPRFVVNYTISDVPFRDGATAEFHLDTRYPLFYEAGHVDEPDVSIATDYETARRVYRDSSWGLDRLRDGFEGGTIDLHGDIDLIGELWVEVVGHASHVAMFDDIMAVTA